ncbi:MAG: hypothetical protein EBV03_08375 [Proteobacteria bacterium]|nr:hypothetical protein [Pseudomonadota bacterium]
MIAPGVILAELNEDQFFHDLATRLHRNGVLKTYEQPQGRDAGWYLFSKESHRDASKNTPGRVYHVGDEPYSVLTTGQLTYYREVDITLPGKF